jgi:putative oxidoreductase
MYFPDIALLIGRVIAGGFFLLNGVNHFAKLNVIAGYAKSKGTFAPALSVGGTGVILLLGGASLLSGYHPTIGVALLVVFLLGVSFSIHQFLGDSGAASQDDGDGQFHEEHGPARPSADDSSHPEALADEPRPLTGRARHRRVISHCLCL